ncbi:MAG: hypothetical protein J07HQW2_03362 [Haloquadratum walsbyi J07HQW2]|uniref:Uncharacterized protein n=1 Tax=Haloquadratum walsbyi J07HQW2 TaxID=1238425 RepID=U1NIZ7_9EURY|nr:MAG: hypothetical protein J07HQW2_03362 [Haloquadratum walsbyi J07HQW2]
MSEHKILDSTERVHIDSAVTTTQLIIFSPPTYT